MKRLRSIVMGVFLVLVAAVPVFAVDGVVTVVPGSDAYSTSWGNNAIYDHVAVLDFE